MKALATTLAVALAVLAVIGIILGIWYGVYWVLACFIDSNWAAVITICLFFLSGGAVYHSRG